MTYPDLLDRKIESPLLAQVLRAYGTQLQAANVPQLVASTSLRRRRSGRALKWEFEDYRFGKILPLDALVQIQQDRLLDEAVAPRMRDAVARGMVDDLRKGKWDLPAPLPEFLRACAAAL